MTIHPSKFPRFVFKKKNMKYVIISSESQQWFQFGKVDLSHSDQKFVVYDKQFPVDIINRLYSDEIDKSIIHKIDHFICKVYRSTPSMKVHYKHDLNLTERNTPIRISITEHVKGFTRFYDYKLFINNTIADIKYKTTISTIIGMLDGLSYGNWNKLETFRQKFLIVRG